MMQRGSVFTAILCLLALAPSPNVSALAAAAPFPDVPPWHWAYDSVQFDQAAGLLIGYPSTPRELAANSVTQVYDGFAHAGAQGAQEWIERFTYNRPPAWPSPLTRARVLRIGLGSIVVAVHEDAATATFTAAVTTRDGRTAASSMRVALRFNGQDWQVNYADLAAGSPIFR
jgi:hypothetical protein